MFLRFCARASAVAGRSCEAASKRRVCPEPALHDSVTCRSYSAGHHSSSPLNLASPPNDLIRLSDRPDMLSGIDADSLRLWPSFLDKQEQEILLLASLKKLDDATGSREERKRRRQWLKSLHSQESQIGFAPDDVYAWEPRHFDGVISSYREMNLSSWPTLPFEEQTAQLLDILKKMYSLLPSETEADGDLTGPSHLLTHLLHLSSTGYIFPHVDNIEASAGAIVGISLGAERTLVLEDGQDRIDIRLPAGSAYLQRGDIRYKWKHSIPAADLADPLQRGQRLSVMIRDRLPPKDITSA